MSDLELDTGNNSEQQTDLIANAKDLGPSVLKDFVGEHILQVKPSSTLIDGASPDRNNFGGIFGRGVGTGTGVHGQSNSGTGVFGHSDSGAGVHGQSDRHTGVLGTGLTVITGDGETGVVGEGRGEGMAGVFGRNANGQGVRGEGRVGVAGTSSVDGSVAVRGRHTGKGFGVIGECAGGARAGVFGRNPDRDGHGVSFLLA